MRPSVSRSLRLVATFAAIALLATACGNDDESGTSAKTTTTAAAEVPQGGTLVVGAEQEPDCMDWIATCSGASWGYWMANVTTLPRTFAVVPDGDGWKYETTSLLAGEPKLETDPKQVVTYTIADDAVWSDGEPMTSSDFKYTWDQIANGDDIYDKTGFTNIEGVDDSDPKVAVVTYATPYAPWKSLFGGQYGILPSHLLEGKDRSAIMANGYSFSGGPWFAKWTKGENITLTPNPKYWGDPPKLDKIVFRFVTDTNAEFAAFKSNEVALIYPQPQIDVVEQIKKGIEGANTQYSADTGNIEALWMNNAEAPLDDIAVRQAVAYAIDRAAIVERLFGPLGVEEPMQTLNPPILSKLSDTTAWSMYTQDQSKVDELMTGAGWTKNADALWEKDGEVAALTIKTTAGNARRELTEQVLQEQLATAGFKLTIDNKEAGDLFGEILPAGDYQMALYAQVSTSLDPASCALFCSANIPGPSNDNSGQNWQRVNIPEIDPLLTTVDESLDDTERADAQKQADQIEAENQISLPLDPLPNILIWSKNIVGPVQDNPVMGPFYNFTQIGVKG